jgi:hypothetical protein
MRKLPTGEPHAGKPLVRFGGRGELKLFPTPIDMPTVYSNPVGTFLFSLSSFMPAISAMVSASAAKSFCK